ncbi:PLDc N-terminal domain-containing protein [Christiangramia sp. ASW11-125]|uniref:PLDc N-terminal domain-containing protein n=1 Tax=Christiangramia sp. ASW11-125 TaxID=3400701 RepID=UPI003AAC0B61
MDPSILLFIWQTHCIIALLLVLYIIFRVNSIFWLKLAWVLAILFVPFIGSIAYLIIGKKSLEVA